MKDLIEAYLSVYEESDVAERTKKAVEHQRKGTHGDYHEMEKESEESTNAVKKATKHRGPKVTPSLPESYVELNQKRQNKMGDQVLRHMKRGTDDDWEKIYNIENQRDTQTPEVSKAKSAANRNRPEAEKRSKTVNETVDLYDVILEHLLDEGYADTEENAITIMANMSEAWIDGILDEAADNVIMTVKSPSGQERSKIRKGASRPSDSHRHENPEQIANRRFSQQLSDREKERQERMRAGRLTVATKRGIDRATNRSDRTDFTPGSALRANERDELPTDYRARRRRAKG